MAQKKQLKITLDLTQDWQGPALLAAVDGCKAIDAGTIGEWFLEQVRRAVADAEVENWTNLSGETLAKATVTGGVALQEAKAKSDKRKGSNALLRMLAQVGTMTMGDGGLFVASDDLTQAKRISHHEKSLKTQILDLKEAALAGDISEAFIQTGQAAQNLAALGHLSGAFDHLEELKLDERGQALRETG
jgi:hypothetical protein